MRFLKIYLASSWRNRFHENNMLLKGILDADGQNDQETN